MKKKNKYKYNTNLTKTYLIGFASFIVMFFLVLVSPMFTGNNYSYADAKENEYEPLTNSIQMALINKEYNPEKKLMRLDFSIEDSSLISNLSNLEFDIKSQYIKKQSQLDIEQKRINDNYLVVLIKGVPDEYSVLSTTINPSYIHLEADETNDLENKSIKVYVNETKKIVNNKLDIENNSYYEEQYIVYKQENLNKEIDTNKKDIEKKNLLIADINKTISDLEKEMDYQTEEEKFETNNKIQSYKTTINQRKTEIEELELLIIELHERIELLNEKKNNI